MLLKKHTPKFEVSKVPSLFMEKGFRGEVTDRGSLATRG
jgi:hypothetical protein